MPPVTPTIIVLLLNILIDSFYIVFH